MVADLLLPLEIVGIPTVREANGLALSSRNRFLTEADRAAAPLLYATLTATARTLAAGGPVDSVLTYARGDLRASGFAVNYLALVDGPTLVPQSGVSALSRLVAAARLGSVRLLDNVAIPGAPGR
jgi:pantoate--beta-alanine ligase